MTSLRFCPFDIFADTNSGYVFNFKESRNDYSVLISPSKHWFRISELQFKNCPHHSLIEISKFKCDYI